MSLWLLLPLALVQDIPTPSWTKLADPAAGSIPESSCLVQLGPRRVLVSGGLFTPASGIFNLVNSDSWIDPVAPMNNPRAGHTCTLLRDGRVLVTGGTLSPGATNAEVYDPVSDLWVPIAANRPARIGATATLLLDGRVLIAGGAGEDGVLLPFAEIFDPSSNRFTASRGQLNSPRRNHAAALLPDGRVAITGGEGLDTAALRSTEFFDPVTSIIWSGPDMAIARRNHTATSLEDGRVLVTGGLGANGLASNTLEVLDPVTLKWATLSSRLETARASHIAMVIPGNGAVLIADGSNPSEVFQPASNTLQSLTSIDPETGFTGAGFVATDEGTIVAAGNGAGAVVNFPAISFSAGVYHPQEMARISGRNLPPKSNVNFALDFIQTTTSAATPQFRILAPRAGSDESGIIPSTPFFFALNMDVGMRLRLTATLPNGEKIIRNSAVKYPTTLSFDLPVNTVESQNVPLLVSIPRATDTAPSATGPVLTTFGPVSLVEIANGAGSVAYSSSRLPTGSLGVTAVYTGDTYYDAAIARTTLGVASRTPVIDIVSSSFSPQIGVPFTVYAQIRVEAPDSVTGAPPITGPVTIYESGVPLGIAKVLSSSTAPAAQIMTSREFTASSFDTLRFTASFAGDANYRPATSGVLSPIVQKAQPTLAISAIPSIFNLIPPTGPPVRFHCDVPLPVYLGLNFPPPLSLGTLNYSLTATLSNGSTQPLPGGFFAIEKPGFATGLATVALPNDAVRITGTFPGDGNMRPASSFALPVAIIPVPVLVEIQGIPKDPIAVDTIITLNLSVTNDAGKGCTVASPQGAIELFDGTSSIGIFPLVDGPVPGVKTVTARASFAAGVHSVFVRYYGDPLHTPTDSAIYTFTVQ
jgi:hypothetical protein